MRARESDPQNCRVRKALKPLHLGWGCFVEGVVPYGVEMTSPKRDEEPWQHRELIMIVIHLKLLGI